MNFDVDMFQVVNISSPAHEACAKNKISGNPPLNDVTEGETNGGA